MRRAFVNSIQEVAKKNDRVALLIGDIGAYLLRDFKKSFPSRFLNMGASEANMMSTAVGLAVSNWIPFVYTITPFVTARCYDQIRVGVGYHNANVKIIGVGSGISYSALGATHHSIEDIALMRSIPGMTILSPADSKETAEAFHAATDHVGPVYIRLMLNVEPLECNSSSDFKMGITRLVREGNDIAIIATGELLREAIKASDLLKANGISVRVLNVHTIKPLDKSSIVRAARETKAIFTVEEHNIIGGLGSAVAEALSEGSNRRVFFRRLGIADSFVNVYGHKHELYEKYKLDANGIYSEIKSALKEGKVLGSK